MTEAQTKAKAKVNAALLYKSLRKTSVATLKPPSLVAGGADNEPNLPRGVVHLRHWLTLNLTVNVANSTSGALTAGGTVSPNGALDYLQQIYYSANNVSKFLVLTGAQAFKIGMWQMGIDSSVNAAHNSIFQNDEIFSIPTASIPANGSTNFTASVRIPINFSGTHTATPNLIGFSTLNPEIKTFEINAQFGIAASMISGLAAGVTASITSATLGVTAEYYPPNYFPISDAYEPLYYAGLAQANQKAITGAVSNADIGGIPYGANYAYKSLFLFVDNTATSPFSTPSDTLVSSVNLIYNTSNYLLNNMSINELKAENQYLGNNAVVPGMFVLPMTYYGNLTDIFNTSGLSSFNMNFSTTGACNLTLIGETINQNIAA
jgi:hypothetical protein